MYYVYAYLTEDGTPFYIGAGKCNRDVSHLRLCQTSYANLPFFYAKLRKMLSSGREPKVVRLLDGLTLHESHSVWEPFFIKALGRRDLQTGPLCNLTDGGDGQHNPSPAWRLAKSKEMTERFSSEEGRAEQSAKMTAYFQNSEARKKSSDRMKAKFANQSEREAQSARTKAYFQDEKARERVIKQMKELSSDPEWRKTKSDLMNKLWNDPSFVAKSKQRWQVGPKVGRYKGISFMKKSRRWRAIVCANGKKVILGAFLTDIEAARAYDVGVDKYRNGVGYKNNV